jgi:hypothetical protein
MSAIEALWTIPQLRLPARALQRLALTGAEPCPVLPSSFAAGQRRAAPPSHNAHHPERADACTATVVQHSMAAAALAATLVGAARGGELGLGLESEPRGVEWHGLPAQAPSNA